VCLLVEQDVFGPWAIFFSPTSIYFLLFIVISALRCVGASPGSPERETHFHTLQNGISDPSWLQVDCDLLKVICVYGRSVCALCLNGRIHIVDADSGFRRISVSSELSRKPANLSFLFCKYVMVTCIRISNGTNWTQTRNE
jgi:hypothetical protein